MDQIEITKADHITGYKTVLCQTRWGEPRSVVLRALSYREVRNLIVKAQAEPLNLSDLVLESSLGDGAQLDQLDIACVGRLSLAAWSLAGLELKKNPTPETNQPELAIPSTPGSSPAGPPSASSPSPAGIIATSKPGPLPVSP